MNTQNNPSNTHVAIEVERVQFTGQRVSDGRERRMTRQIGWSFMVIVACLTVLVFPGVSSAINGGYQSVFGATQSSVRKIQIATRVSMPQTGTITSITAYVGGKKKKVRLAIYADVAGEPGALLAETDKEDTSKPMTWLTISLPNTVVTTGSYYWLALSFKDDAQGYAYDGTGGQTRYNGYDAQDEGFLSNWGTSTVNSTRKISIYATYAVGGGSVTCGTGEFRVNTTTAGEQEKTDVSMGISGSVVVWADEEANRIVGQRFDSGGAPAGAEFQINTSSAKHRSPSVVMADDGRFVAVWENHTNDQVFFRRFDASGVAVGGEVQVSTAVAENEGVGAAMANDGSFVITWENDDAQTIQGRRYNASGAALGSEFQVNTTVGDNKNPSIAMADGGSFVVAWENENVQNIIAQRYDSAGNALGGETQVNASTASHEQPVVAMATGGSFVVAWENDTSDSVIARRFSSSGSALGAEFQINASAGENEHPRISMAGGGAFVVAWENETGDDVFARRYDSSGNPQAAEFQVNTSTDEQKKPGVAMADDESFMVVWENDDDDNIFAQRYDPNGNVAGALFSDVSVATGFNVATAADQNKASGLYWGDLDNDGDLDAIITGSASARLMINNGGTSFTVSTFGGGDVRRQGAMVDLDNDGDLDFWATGLAGWDTEKLYDNNGSAVFTDMGDLGLSSPTNNEGVAAADANGDGWADIFMFSGDANWVGQNQGGSPTTLVETKATSVGLNDAGDAGNGYYCSSGDVNNDGYADFFYHYSGGKLFLSNGDGTYSENASGIWIATISGSSTNKSGSAWADYDNDGDLDLFAARFDSGSTGYLWQNNGGTFTNVTTTAGITDTSGQRGCCWGDYDLDGDLDLYIVTRGGLDNVLYKNNGDGTFSAVCAGAEAPGDGHDAVFVDYDNDGDLDLAITQQGGTNTLLRNSSSNNKYLKVRVIGGGAGRTNTSAVGVRVDLYAANGTTYLGRRDIGVARGYGGMEPIMVHFGGVDPSQTYVVKVHFADGIVSSTVVPANASTTIGLTTLAQTLTVAEQTGKLVLKNWGSGTSTKRQLKILQMRQQAGWTAPTKDLQKMSAVNQN